MATMITLSVLISSESSASITAVIQISEQVISLCVEYASSVKEAPKEIQNIRAECESVLPVLSRLQVLCDKTSNSRHLPTLQLLVTTDGPLTQYQAQLLDVAEKLRLPSDWKKTLQVLRWPMKSKDVANLLITLERKKALFTLAISMDHMFVTEASCCGLSRLKSGQVLLEGHRGRLARYG
jgi:hypothetical protein